MLTDIGGSAQRIYERIYCRRGEAENRLKELEAGLGLDRTSCHNFLANQFRVLLAAAAYALLQELRWQARETEVRAGAGAAAAGLSAQDGGVGEGYGEAGGAAPAAGSAGGGGVAGDSVQPGRCGTARSGRLNGQRGGRGGERRGRRDAVRLLDGGEPVSKRPPGRRGPWWGAGRHGRAVESPWNGT